MYQLKFDEKRCLACPDGACLVQCQYLKYEADPARKEMVKIFRGEDSPVLQDCVTCYACEEYCKRGNHPFYLINERRENKGILTAPRAITRQWIHIGEPKGKYELGRIGKIALSFGFMPQLKEITKGRLFEDVMPSYFFGQEFFCNVVYIHFANTKVFKERLPVVIENIHKLGVEEVVFLHDECYAAFTSLAPAYGMEVPFKSVHYFEYLYNRLTALKDLIRPLNVKVVYQRPCSNRLCGDSHLFVRKIMDRIGATLVQRTYQDETALCCGSIFRAMYGYDLMADVQGRNLEDMAQSGAEYCIFNCHGCMNALSPLVAARGMTPLHLIDLCRMAIGETPEGGQ
ncbi:MAG: hypothetical protein A4E69_02724 [Syntrophus sp. PtaB.Bin138]|nr:MAG: hypothetical protein A4E69_02724 [Syntrophus sp. PtaB.Bin138]